MARSMDHDDDRHPNDPTFRSATTTQTPAPLPAQPAPPPPSTLAPPEQARRNELLAKPEGERSAEEKKELETLEARNVLKPMPQEQVVRLRDLRLLHERNQLNDADRAELAKLNSAESEAAGHLASAEVKAGPDDGSWVIYELLSFIEQIIARTPSYHDLDIRVRMLRSRFDDSRDPEKKDAAKAA